MRTLIIYFSYSNNTKRLVDKIRKELPFEVVRVERKKPYSLDYNTCAYVEAKEEWEKKIYPDINDLDENLNSYNRILLFFPIWWYTFPMPIGTLVKEIRDYKGEIIVFANSYTNDPQYMKNSMEDIRLIAPKLNLKEGLFNKTAKEHIKFIRGE